MSEENPPPSPPFSKEGSQSFLASPFEKGGLRGILIGVIYVDFGEL